MTVSENKNTKNEMCTAAVFFDGNAADKTL